MKKLLKYPLIPAFWGFVGLFMLLDVLLPGATYSEIENRQLASMPKLTLSSLMSNSFTGQFEVYLNDHFLLRDGWITLKSMSESALLKTENNGIVYGAEGSMFEKHRPSLTQYYTRNIQRIADFVAAHPQRRITLAIAPGAEVVQTDRLPAGMPVYDELTAINQAYSAIEAAGGQTIDVYSALYAHREEYIYFRTDHHWTARAARIFAESFLAAAGRPIPDFDKIEIKSLSSFLGTHYNKAKSWNARPDHIDYYEVPLSSVHVAGEPKPAYYDAAQFDTRDKYAAFLWGNAGLTVLRRTEQPESRLLIIKDSYANILAPLLTQSYDEVVLIDLRALTTHLSDYLAGEDFDDILILYSFRSLGSDNNIAKLNY